MSSLNETPRPNLLRRVRFQSSPLPNHSMALDSVVTWNNNFSWTFWSMFKFISSLFNIYMPYSYRGHWGRLGVSNWCCSAILINILYIKMLWKYYLIFLFDYFLLNNKLRLITVYNIRIQYMVGFDIFIFSIYTNATLFNWETKGIRWVGLSSRYTCRSSTSLLE